MVTSAMSFMSAASLPVQRCSAAKKRPDGSSSLCLDISDMDDTEDSKSRRPCRSCPLRLCQSKDAG